MNLRKITIHLLVLTLALLFLGSCCSDQPPSTQKLQVALYPYVPRPGQFEEVLKQQWNAMDTGWELDLVSWDCYGNDPHDSLDVFVYDGIFHAYFIDQGYLLPIHAYEIDQLNDFEAYALEGCKRIPTDTMYYGLPQIGCTNIFYHHKDDAALASANSLDEILAVLGKASYDTVPPPSGAGLLMDMSGSTTNACLYLEASMDFNETYSWDPKLPASDSLQEAVVRNLIHLIRMGGARQVTYSADTAYQRARWYNKGMGRALVGFTEAMSQMPDILNDLSLKVMPLSDDAGYNLFYTDIVGINRKVSDEKKKAAIKLANLLASSNYIIQAFGTNDTLPNPQYLMPVRQSVFEALGAQWPMYRKMDSIVTYSDPKPFRIGPDSREWLNKNKSAIREKIISQAASMSDVGN